MKDPDHTLSLSSDDRLRPTVELPNDEEIGKALDGLKATPEQREQITWLVAESRVLGLTTFAGVAKFLGKSRSTVSRLLRGQYDASLDPIADQIRDIRAARQQTGETDGDPFVPQLSVVEEITTFAALVRETHQMGIVNGKNQTGKSRALQYIASTWPDTIYWKLPAGGSTKKSMAAAAEAMGIPSRKNDLELWQRIRQRVTKHTLLLVDEFHQAVHAGRRIQTTTVDRIRELHDDCGCGVLLCGTEHVANAFTSPEHQEFLAQTGNRGRLRLYIPTEPTKKDFLLICAAYKLPPPSGEAETIAKKIARMNGIAALTDLFKLGKLLSARDGRGLTWEDFLAVHATMAAYGNPQRKLEDSL